GEGSGPGAGAAALPHPHPAGYATGRTEDLERRVLDKNQRLADENRAWLRRSGIVLVNLMSSPGSGKTTLLERAVADLCEDRRICVIEGDQATPFDAERIRAAGCPAVQVNTGAGCHLDARMVRDALRELAPARGSLVFVENVGNLVCPALFDLGEDHRAVVMSVTEGVDKPLKYPHMFGTADLVLLNKTDLLPYVDFDPIGFHARVRQVNPDAEILEVSATRGQGLEAWYAWLEERSQVLAAAASAAATGASLITEIMEIAENAAAPGTGAGVAFSLPAPTASAESPAS
ncbi:hydrogenase nickel incorporation protein HypB, partial [Actinospica durhamensis]